MSDRLDAEAVFIKHLDTIDRAAAKASRRYSLWYDEAEDFRAWVKMKLIEDDYAVFHKFRGESNWKTFLTTVVARLAVSYLRTQLGRWRPSQQAVRSGPPAPELEMLVHRDRYTLSQAGEKLRTSGTTQLSDLELARLLGALPDRRPLRPEQVPVHPLIEEAQAEFGADAPLAAAEFDAWRGKLTATLVRALERLEPEERVIVRLYYGLGFSAADIARALNIEQKPLYRRIPRLRDTLRGYLEEEGISAEDVRSLLMREDP
jgi:RNA polymerase sigma factor (sigma-70 family)